MAAREGTINAFFAPFSESQTTEAVDQDTIDETLPHGHFQDFTRDVSEMSETIVGDNEHEEDSTEEIGIEEDGIDDGNLSMWEDIISAEDSDEMEDNSRDAQTLRGLWLIFRKLTVVSPQNGKFTIGSD